MILKYRSSGNYYKKIPSGYYKTNRDVVLGVNFSAFPFTDINSKFLRTIAKDKNATIEIWFSKNVKWNGSNVVIDTKNSMFASLVHDMICDYIEVVKHTDKYTKKELKQMRLLADKLYRDLCIEDGMSKIRAYCRYIGIRKYVFLKGGY